MESWQEVDKYFVLYAGMAGMLLLCGGLLLLFRVYHRRLMAEQQAKNNRELQHKDELLFGNIAATEKERARIARDLHDEVGASLSLLRMHVGQLPEAHETKPIIDDTIDNVRRIAYGLLPPMLEKFGIVAALGQLADSIASQVQVNTRYENIDDTQRFGKQVELTVYRVLQELINNTLKHAGAKNINIHLTCDDSALVLQYHDDGSGYDVSEQIKKNSLGLKNIELRVKQCDGVISYTNLPGGAVQIKITIPINNSHE